MRLLAVFLTVCALTGPAQAARPVVLFDASDTSDASFNTAVREGIETFERYHETEVPWLAPSKPTAQSQKDLEALVLQAIKQGYGPIICVGFPYTAVVAKVAAANPDTRFVLIDSVADGDNVQSIVFAEEQGSFLVGVLAATASKTGVVGFVGGRDSDVIRNFACGFAQGVGHQSPDTKLLVRMAGTTNDAFRDPDKGAELTRKLAAEGADIVFHAAGGTGNGVIAAARELGIKAIGVDRNQNSMAPGTVLTSMLKQVDVAVFMALSTASGRNWKPGIWRLGLEKGGVGWALDEHNRALVSEAAERRMHEVRSGLISGAITAHRYADDLRCPAYRFAPLAD